MFSPRRPDIDSKAAKNATPEDSKMRFAIHPVWSTTSSPRTLRYGLYAVSAQGEKELARADSMPVIEQIRNRMIARGEKRRG